MRISKKGLDLIKKYEGFYSKPYICPGGKPTIGYGITYYLDGKKVSLFDNPITEEEALQLLEQILNIYEKQVSSLINKKISQNQFDALVSFTYNLGATNLSKSSLLKKVNTNPNDKSIRDEFMKWVNTKGKKINGLIKRRQDEANLYFS